MAAKRIIVIGSGIAGLASAIRLAAEGFSVTVLEAADGPGGKLRTQSVEGRHIDCGPTVLTMRWVFDALFADTGGNFGSAVALERAEVLARHAWDAGADGKPRDPRAHLDLFADQQRSIDAIGRFAGAANAKGFERFLKRAEAIYDTLAPTFMEAERPSLPGLVARVAARNPMGLSRIQPFATLWGDLGRYFPDPRLRQLFARYATYCGSSPFSAPATLMLVAHVEQCGVWLVPGGLKQIAAALAAHAKSVGVDIRYDARVSRIDHANGAATAVTLADGQRIGAQAVVYNGDVSALDGLIDPGASRTPHAIPRARRSLSALTISTIAHADGFPLSHHNVFFSDAYRSEFNRIFKAGRLPLSPTVYVCAQDRGGAETASDARATTPGDEERERLFLLINAPATGDLPEGHPNALTQAEIDQCLDATHRLLARSGLMLESQSVETQVTTPQAFAAKFPGSGGALYGMASHGWRASFLRRGAKSRLSNVYLAGGSVHPGPGMPMAALSGRLAATRLMSDLASTSRSRRAAMPGGIATPSATTGSTG
ncbi:MAG: 1-hydroxycarotenoid 3,4-desaturase CrtD [Pseudomonadota bacterium]